MRKAPSIAIAPTASQPRSASIAATTTSRRAAICASSNTTITSSRTRAAASRLPGAATGSDLADFLIGIPDASSIAFGNADKYFRQTVYDAYVTDDWRVLPILTINAGVRWEYGAPMTELQDRLVNLDVTPGFTQVAPVLSSDPVGPVTGQTYPNFAGAPDRLGIRAAHRHFVASHSRFDNRHSRAATASITTRRCTSLPCFSWRSRRRSRKACKQQNSADCPLTLANGFTQCGITTPQTFGIDPNFRVGYAQTWQVSIQRDLPWALQMTATYLGVKGTHGVQQFLPNSYPLGAANPCPACPSGFVYETSGGNSTRQSGQLQLRRRLRGGFTASLLYTYSKSIDDDAMLGGQGHQSSASQTDFSAASSTSSSGNTPDRAGLARPDGGTIALLLRSAPSPQSAGAVHDRPGTRRWNIARRLARSAAEGVDAADAVECRHRPAGDAGVSGGRAGHWLDRPIAAEPDRRPSTRRTEWRALQCIRLHRTRRRHVGHCGQKFDHRAKPVQSRRRHAAHISTQQALLSRCTHRCDELAESSCIQ